MDKKNKKTILVITDGIGHNEQIKNNAFAQANKPTYDNLFKTTPYSLIQTSGLSVGLPEGQMGNSEVGHMTLGSGRIIYQNLVKINKAIQEKTLSSNKALQDLLHVSKTVHIIGLLSDGGVHSHINHIKELAQISKKEGKKVFIHAITDGRDVSPTSGISYMRDIATILDENVQIASISGRFYTMDRDKRWERVHQGYQAMVEALPKTTKTPEQYLKEQYAQNITDEFITPIAMKNFDGIKEGDGVILANFRNDRMREIASALGEENFDEFSRKNTYNVITMTEYDATFDFPVMFKKETLKNTLCEIIAQNNLLQFHIAETEKYAHVTFFFNGGVETPMENETRLLVPSPKVATYDLQPEMSAKEVTDGVLKAMEEEYDFIVVNYANGDMVGHTGNLQASIKAVEAIDESLGRVIEKCDKKGYNLVLTSDHGNCENMQSDGGDPLTNHTLFDVYCFVRAHGVKKVKKGGLNNIAATILTLMDIDIPQEMDAPLI